MFPYRSFIYTALLMASLSTVAVAHEGKHATAVASQTLPLLSLSEAMSKTLKKSPSLKAAGLQVDISQAGVTQATLIPNPELSYESENFDGSGLYKGGTLREETITLSQQIVLGGKVGDRIQIAENRLTVAQIDNEIAFQSISSEVVIRFVTALINQLRLQNAEEVFELAEHLASATTARVEAGKEPPFYVMNANAALFKAKASYERSKNEFINSRRRLSSLWGESAPGFERLMGNIENVVQPPKLADVVSGVENYPQFRRNAFITADATADLNLQSANRWPDLTLAVGERKFNESDDRAYVAGATVAIPLFDRNQGAHRAAVVRLLQAKEESRKADLDFRLEMESVLSNLWTAYHELESFRRAGLTASHEAMLAATEGYREGKLSYVAAIDARRVLVEVQARYLDALERYHTLRATLNKLTGESDENAGAWLLQEEMK